MKQHFVFYGCLHQFPKRSLSENFYVGANPLFIYRCFPIYLFNFKSIEVVSSLYFPRDIVFCC